MALNEKIVEARKKAKKSQEVVAHEIGVALRVYQTYESGKVQPKNRRALEKSLNLPIGALDDTKMEPADQMEFLKSSFNALMSGGNISDNDVEVFLCEMAAIAKDAKSRRKSQESEGSE